MSIHWNLDLPDPEATRRLGRLLGEHVEPGLVVALVGDLGAGKTALTKAVVAAQGAVEEDDVVSPTFVLAQEYPGRVPTLHIDAYRLADPAGLIDLGYDLAAGLTVIEWADRVASALPEDRLTLTLDHQPPGRSARFDARGERAERVLKAVIAAGRASGFGQPDALK